MCVPTGLAGLSAYTSQRGSISMRVPSSNKRAPRPQSRSSRRGRDFASAGRHSPCAQRYPGRPGAETSSKRVRRAFRPGKVGVTNASP